MNNPGYDVFNRRIAKAVDTTSPFSMTDAVIESYVYDDANGVTSVDGGNVVLDFVDPDGTGSSPSALESRQLFGNAVDQILAQEDIDESLASADRVLWHLGDHLQTVRDLAKNDGTLGEHYEYDSYGQIVSGDTSVTRYLYTAREFDDESGLQYNRARWYDAAVGRWISEDPIGFGAGDSNITRYVGNAVTNASDPTGLKIVIKQGDIPDDIYKDERDHLRELLKEMEEMDGVIGAIIRRIIEDEDTMHIIIKNEDFDPHATIETKKGANPTINIPADDDYVAGPKSAFPDGDGISDHDRRIIVLIHEAGHAHLTQSDPENVNLENMAREQLGVPLRDDYEGMEIPPFSDRNQRRMDIIMEREMRRMQAEMDREEQRRRIQEQKEMDEAMTESQTMNP